MADRLSLTELRNFAADCGFDDIENMSLDMLLHIWKEFGSDK